MITTKQKTWTYEDYYQLDDDKRYEVIEGELIEMPSPRYIHQKISIKLASKLLIYCENSQLGVVLTAPFDTILSDINTFQPDILFISEANLSIIQERGVFGTPDLVVEILSPSNQSHDRVKKFKLYEKFKVKEFWIVDPDQQSIKVYSLESNKLLSISDAKNKTPVKSKIFTNLNLSFHDLVN